VEKEILAVKSYKELIWIAIFLLFDIYMTLSILNYYQFKLAELPNVILILFIVLVVSFVALVIYGIILILYPLNIIYSDDKHLFVHKLNKKIVTIQIKDIEDVHTTINIWAKPFLVYTSLVIQHESKSTVIRFAKQMYDVKEKIQHKMRTYETEGFIT